MLAALAGGVGAARFLAGLVQAVPAAGVVAVVNTADDTEIHGLHVAPDLDSVTYTLAGASDPVQGWGLAGESFTTLAALSRYPVETWFRLGDNDLATHLFRTERLRAGAPLSEVTRVVTSAWGVAATLLPMTDDRVRTRITVRDAAQPGGTLDLALQEWFVRERAAPPVVAVAFDGADTARPAPGVLDAIRDADVLVVCPSNPVISIGPILAVPGVRAAVAARRDRNVAVSPIVGGRPVKGPADRLMGPLGMEVSCVGVARAYAELCRVLVIDEVDAARAPEIRALGMEVVVTDTIMRDRDAAAALAHRTLEACG